MGVYTSSRIAFSTRSARVEEKARAYAARHGTTLTGALELALDKAAAEERATDGESFDRAAYEEWMKPIRAMQAAAAKLPDNGPSDDEIMGWDENGLPT